MLIGDKYKVEADRMNIILSMKVVAKEKDDEDVLDDGEDEKEQGWKKVGYFYDFRELLKYIVDNEIKGEGLSDFMRIAAKQEEIYKLISSMPTITPEQIPFKTRKINETVTAEA